MKKTGEIEALNVSPKGSYEGFLLKTGKKLVQINFAKEDRGTLGQYLNAGKRVSVKVAAKNTDGDSPHEVFKLIRLLGVNGHTSQQEKGGSCNFKGRVEKLNYALGGEMNGGILDSGDFLHLKPRGARAVHLTLGLRVAGKGRRKPMVGGHSVIEADVVNGIRIRDSKK